MCQQVYFDKKNPHVSCFVYFNVGVGVLFFGQPGYPTCQVAYETGYYSTVFQPRDGGASVE